MSEYTVFIDESGEAGISSIRSSATRGASPYMTLGAALVKNTDLPEIKRKLSDLRSEIGKTEIHCNKLNHFQKVHVAKTISTLPIVSFGVISQKQTLGWYSDRIDQDSKKYYNKCAQYLLECIGEYMQSIEKYSHQLDVVFERGNFDYPALRRLITLCKNNPLGTPLQKKRLRLLQKIDPQKIVSMKKNEEPLLELADVIAHSIYKAIDRSSRHYDILEVRYLKELSSCFFKNPETLKIIGTGIRPIHKLADLGRDEEAKNNLLSLDV